MGKEHLFVKCEMWVEEGEDGNPVSVRYSYKLPNIENDLVIELYKMFLESLCSEIAKLEGAGEVLSVLSERGEENTKIQ